jgi:hypothetical protein
MKMGLGPSLNGRKMADEKDITITGIGPDELRSLRNWLSQEDELRGRVSFTEPAPAPGFLGAAVEALTVSLGSGGAISVLVAGAMAWMRQHYPRYPSASTAIIKIRRADGASIEISAPVLSATSPAEIAAQVRQLTIALESGNGT